MEFDSFRMIDLPKKKQGIDELGFPFIIDESSELIKTDNCVEKDCISQSKVYKFRKKQNY